MITTVLVIVGCIAISLLIFHTILPFIDEFIEGRKDRVEQVEPKKEDTWEPGRDLPWELQIMCDQTERFSLEQIVEACEMKILHPELVVDVSEDDDVGYVAGPIPTDIYGFPAVGATAFCQICQTNYNGPPHLHSNITMDYDDDVHP